MLLPVNSMLRGSAYSIWCLEAEMTTVHAMNSLADNQLASRGSWEPNPMFLPRARGLYLLIECAGYYNPYTYETAIVISQHVNCAVAAAALCLSTSFSL